MSHLSHLSNEVSRSLRWIEHLAEELLEAAKELDRDAATVMNNPCNEEWDEEQCAAIRDAIGNQVDNVEPSITFATALLRSHGNALLGALGTR